MTSPLLVGDFDYVLPPDRIAQHPVERRDASRLLVLDRGRGAPTGLGHHRFDDLPSLLRPGDLLVVNDTQVLPARLVGRRGGTDSGGRVEALLVERMAVTAAGAQRSGTQTWRALLKGRVRPGEAVDFGAGLIGKLERRDAEYAVVELSATTGDVEGSLSRAGRMPVPPYIKRAGRDDAGQEDPRETMDRERYQTIFARWPGSIAAPTAGLHFTPELIGLLRTSGVEIGSLTLHVGTGTFQPVRVSRIEQHRMHAEAYEVPVSLAQAVASARGRGGRVVAVGTTVVRALECRAGARDGLVRPGRGVCDLFIHPGHRFQVVDALVTNFHLPRSTLLMLVAAFAGRETILEAYAAAIEARYRFYSYGDAMLIV